MRDSRMGKELSITPMGIMMANLSTVKEKGEGDSY